MRKKIFALIGLGLLISLPAFADGESCRIERLFSQLSAQADIVIDDSAHEVDTSLLFYQFPIELETGRNHVRFEIRRDGRLLLAEEISLIAAHPALRMMPVDGTSSGTVVELLSTAPAERSRLRPISANGGAEISVFLDGGVFETLSFAELAARAEALRQDMPMPHAISSRLMLEDAAAPAPEKPRIVTKGACEDACYAQFDTCWDNCVWVPNSGPCFDQCEQTLDDCLFDCSGQCYPSTSVNTTYTLVETVVVEPWLTCVKRTPFGSSDYYRRLRLRYKATETTTTTHADCSVTVSTRIYYFYVFCWNFASPGPCSSPITDPSTC